MKLPMDHYRVKPDSKVDLCKIPSQDDGGVDKIKGKAQFRKLRRNLATLQEALYAQHKHALLVVFQAMDTGGKDSTIRSVFTGVNPAGISVTSFKAPSTEERDHDYLWRIHDHAPPTGMIHVFNRSHYEDVLVVRVKNLVPAQRWKRRYEHINAFEKILHDEGTMIVKFYLHISKDYQKERLQRRLDRPDKHWKFNPDDLAERARWAEYQAAYDAALSHCSTKHAPWYIIPAERRWYRDLLIASVLVDTLTSLKMNYPQPTFDPATIAIE
ncbi:MAG: polyphosphate kinase 2 family protein [Phycisphaeraceae bacterium]